MVHNLIIIDKEEGYCRRFAGFINTQNAFPFEARYFTSTDGITDYSKHNDIDIVLVSNDMEPYIDRSLYPIVLILTDNNVGNIISRGVIYKYQSCELIIKTILSYVAENNEINRLVTRCCSMKIIGFYSPVKRSGQTSMAITMGKLLAAKSRVLYVNLECSSGIEEYLGIEFRNDMSDIMYDVKNGHKEISASIGSVVHNLSGLDIFPVMRDFRDLAGMTFDEWKELLKKLESDTDYEYIILDLSDAVSGLAELLLLCNVIYMSQAGDKVAVAKLNHFLKNLDSEYVEILEKKIRRYDIASVSNISEGALLGSSEVRDYCSSLLGELREE